MGIQEWKQSPLLVVVLRQTETRAAVALGSRQHHSWAQQEGVQLLLGQSLSLCLSLSPWPASGEPETAFFSSGVAFPLALSWPAELAGSAQGGQIRQGRTDVGQCLINTHAELVEQDWGQHGLSKKQSHQHLPPCSELQLL